MKKSILTFSLALLTFTAFAQKNVIEKHFGDYKSQDEFTSISVTGAMFKLAAHLDSDDNDPEFNEFVDFVSSVTAFNMIIGEGIENVPTKYKSALSKVDRGYEELMSIDDHEGKFTFYIDEYNGMVSELVGVGSSDGHLIIFSLSGDMNLKDLSKMGSKLQGEGLGKIKKLEDNRIDQIKVYPNPVESSADLTIELPDEMIGAEMTLYNMSGVAQLKQTTTKRKLMLKTNGFASGQYVLEMTKDGVSVKRKVTIL